MLACNVRDDASLCWAWAQVICLILVEESGLLVWRAQTRGYNWQNGFSIDLEHGITVSDLDVILFIGPVSGISWPNSHLGNPQRIDRRKSLVFVALKGRMLAWRVFFRGKWAPCIEGIHYLFVIFLVLHSNQGLDRSKFLVNSSLMLVELSNKCTIFCHQVLNCPFMRFNFLHVIDYFVILTLYKARCVLHNVVKFIQTKKLALTLNNCCLRLRGMHRFLIRIE